MIKTTETIALGTALRRCREAAGLSVMDAAVKVGTIATSVYKWEQGKHVPTEENKAKLAAAYRCSVADFYR